MKQTYVLVADGTRARVFFTERPPGPLREIEDMVHPEGRLHARELSSDSPGRTYDSAGRGRHSLVEPTDQKRAETQAFAHRIAKYFQELHVREPTVAIILVAAPDLLGLLRKQFDKTTMKAVEREVDKNLAHLSVTEISKRLGFALD